MGRTEVWILTTQWTDRFGHWVRYSYDTSDRLESPLHLGKRWAASRYFPRREWDTPHSRRRATVRNSDHDYSSTGTCRPSHSRKSSTWQFSCKRLERDMFENAIRVLSSELVLWMQHLCRHDCYPSGDTGTFNLKENKHGRPTSMAPLLAVRRRGQLCPTYSLLTDDEQNLSARDCLP